MKDDRGRMVVVELFGLPGSGKSTVTDLVIDKLGNYRVKTLSTFRAERETSFIKLGLKHFKLFRLLVRFIFSEHMKFDKDKIRYIKSILMTIDYYKANNDADYLIMEQGWLQDIISLCFDHKIKNQEALVKIIDEIGAIYIPVATKIEIEESFRRMSIRSKEPGRLDKEVDGDTRKRIYSVFQANIEQLNDVLNECLIIDTTISPAENAEVIVKSIVS